MADTYDLDLVQGETFIRTFAVTDDDAPFDFTLFTVRAQIRDKESTGGALLLDLSDYCTKAVDGLSVRLRIPANVTSEVDPKKFGKAGATAKARWDLFAIETADPTNGRLILQGAASCDPATTDTVDDVTP